jgi:hypothetical protein
MSGQALGGVNDGVSVGSAIAERVHAGSLYLVCGPGRCYLGRKQTEVRKVELWIGRLKRGIAGNDLVLERENGFEEPGDASSWLRMSDITLDL